MNNVNKCVLWHTKRLSVHAKLPYTYYLNGVVNGELRDSPNYGAAKVFESPEAARAFCVEHKLSTYSVLLCKEPSYGSHGIVELKNCKVGTLLTFEESDAIYELIESDTEAGDSYGYCVRALVTGEHVWHVGITECEELSVGMTLGLNSYLYMQGSKVCVGDLVVVEGETTTEYEVIELNTNCFTLRKACEWGTFEGIESEWAWYFDGDDIPPLPERSDTETTLDYAEFYNICKNPIESAGKLRSKIVLNKWRTLNSYGVKHNAEHDGGRVDIITLEGHVNKYGDTVYNTFTLTPNLVIWDSKYKILEPNLQSQYTHDEFLEAVNSWIDEDSATQ